MQVPELTASGIASVLIFWLIVWHRWSRQAGRPLPTVSAPNRSPLKNPPLVSIIVPARNEAHQITACVRSLLAQDYPRFEVIVVDDCSEDGTGALVAHLAETDARLTMVRGSPLPEGWMGKAHACYQGYCRAQGDWLLFTDADTEHASFLLSGVMAHMLDSGASFATVLARQRHPSFGVYLANLAAFTYIFMVVDPKGFTNPRSRQSLVNGQFLLFSQEAYEAIGTHAAVRHYSSTDVSLGYLAKLEGWVPLLIDGRRALQTTMYRRFSEAFLSWSRSLVNGIWTALGPSAGSLVLLTLTVGLCLFWIAPWLLWVRGLVSLNSTALLVSSLQIFAGLAVLRIARERWLVALRDGLLMPIAFLLFTAMVGVGLARAGMRRGTLWKGRLVQTAQRLPRWKPKAVRIPRHARDAGEPDPAGAARE